MQQKVQFGSSRSHTHLSKAGRSDSPRSQGEQPAGPRDCCTRFIYDEDGAYGTEGYLREHGFFNISWVKVRYRIS